MNRALHTCGTIQNGLTHVMRVPEGKESENRAEILFEKIMPQNPQI